MTEYEEIANNGNLKRARRAEYVLALALAAFVVVALTYVVFG